jgi:hypothetical protein
MLDDFIRTNETLGSKRNGGVTYELEKRMLTNFNCGVLYVSNEWEIPEIQTDMDDDIHNLVDPPESDPTKDIEMIKSKKISPNNSNDINN